MVSPAYERRFTRVTKPPGTSSQRFTEDLVREHLTSFVKFFTALRNFTETLGASFRDVTEEPRSVPGSTRLPTAMGKGLVRLARGTGQSKDEKFRRFVRTSDASVDRVRSTEDAQGEFHPRTDGASLVSRLSASE